ncbi:MAG TPA: GNAT family N-acetyltransferase [Ilumatobacteraceae bacterium]
MRRPTHPLAIAPIPTPTIVTERLTLTPLTVADAVGMVEVYADQRMHEFTGGAPPSAPQLRERYERLVVGRNHDGSEQWCNWIVRFHGCPSPIGAMQATIAHDLAGAAVAWEIGVDHQGRGVAVEAACALVDWLFASGVERITASIHPDHAASAGVAARAGLVATDEVDDAEIVWHRVRDIVA